MANPNPVTPIPRNNTGSPASTISHPSSSTSITPSSANLDRFLQQAEHDDGTLHGRASNRTYRPFPDIHIPSYEARAAAAIAACDAVLGCHFSAPFQIEKCQESMANHTRKRSMADEGRTDPVSSTKGWKVGSLGKASDRVAHRVLSAKPTKRAPGQKTT
ncbi:predicted protein [Chaetomium globosum CBS 148.51]|uniref:Uncharacterized protein n=1 Tax=Chaetomium globosum (strain ATCC 6205 / CBS 148.51 / DSM 1962 / NBRC 6347 / NRRL 1970) TaxID=306901 RepID=Q2GNH5_CHAGB|nr:uncharacterized protein CHGG_10479 [Chaetomium globosum CBS 148.51]EAQ84075.1 predicted protein [Chaetomium globosum CBS 148.51]